MRAAAAALADQRRACLAQGKPPISYLFVMRDLYSQILELLTTSVQHLQSAASISDPTRLHDLVRLCPRLP
tara:strand:- start:754 stop:966 length:213 start_codon:yes stop_codon:yes gene_type:complete